jgi:hypothetical protein
MRFLSSPFARSYLAAGRNRIQLQRLLKRQQPAPLYIRQRDGGAVLVHRSTRKPGWWQATFFDSDLEPYADSENDDWAALLDHIHGYDIDWRTAQVARPEMVPNASHLDGVARLVEEAEAETLDDFEAYYPASASGELAEDVGDAELYAGRDVVWIGSPGRMVRVDPAYVRHIEGNIFYGDKLAAVVAGIRAAEDRVPFVAPYGQATKIGLQDIAESQEYWEDEGLDRPLTTGDEDVDAYLVDAAGYLDHFGEPGDEEYEEAKQEMDEAVAALEKGDGDFGEWTFVVRDGNHRAFGALIAGEPYVWMILTDNDYQDLREQAENGFRAPEYAELWGMLE